MVNPYIVSITKLIDSPYQNQNIAIDTNYKLEEDSFFKMGDNQEIHLSAELSYSTACITIEMELRYILVQTCSRCLENIESQQKEKVRDYFFFKEKIEDSEDEVDYLVNEDMTIDLEQLVTNTIVLSANSNFICSSNCKGLCQVCGVNLNTEINHTHSETSNETNPFSSLKDSFKF